MIEYIDCLSIASEINATTERLLNGASPVLSVIGFEGDPDDELYLNGVRKDAAKLGISIKSGMKPNTDGVLLFGQFSMINELAELDIDGVGENSPHIRAVTEAVTTILESRMPLIGKNVTVIGRNLGVNIAGKLIAKDASVAITHSKTGADQLAKFVGASDVVVCTARGSTFGSGMLRDGTTVIDVSNSFKFSELDEMEPRKLYVTPRINGVGIVTRAILLNRLANNYVMKRCK